MTDTKTALVFTYTHLPDKLQFLANPPKDITKNKYNDVKYLERVVEMINELKDNDFKDRIDGVCPYSKKTITIHIQNRIIEIKQKGEKTHQGGFRSQKGNKKK